MLRGQQGCICILVCGVGFYVPCVAQSVFVPVREHICLRVECSSTVEPLSHCISPFSIFTLYLSLKPNGFAWIQDASLSLSDSYILSVIHTHTHKPPWYHLNIFLNCLSPHCLDCVRAEEQTWVREMLSAAMIYLLWPPFVVNIKPFCNNFLRVWVTRMHIL